MMALHVSLRRERPVGAIVGYSGALAGAAELARHTISRPPVLLIHGSEDQIVPVAALHAAKRELQRMGIDVTAHVCQGLGHAVDPEGIRLGRDFVAAALA